MAIHAELCCGASEEGIFLAALQGLPAPNAGFEQGIGGAVFVLSDPVAVEPDRDYLLTARMRHFLDRASEAVFLSVIQFDAAGREIAQHHAVGQAGDNRWRWQAQGLTVRIGLIAATAKYLDMDALR